MDESEPGEGAMMIRSGSHSRIPHASVLFRYWIGLGVAAVVIAVVTAVVAVLIPTSYSATASLSVSFSSPSGGQLDSSDAGNTVAAQIAGLANSDPVITNAANILGISKSGLAGRVSGVQNGTSNLINVVATGSTASSAAQLASADARSLRVFVQGRYTKQVASGVLRIGSTPNQVLTSSSIAQAQVAIAADEAIIKAGPSTSPAVANAISDVTSQRQFLSSLIGNNHAAQTVNNLVLGIPSIVLVNGNPSGASSALSPIIVGVLALVIGFFVAWEALYLFLNGKRAYEADNHPGQSVDGGDA